MSERRSWRGTMLMAALLGVTLLPLWWAVAASFTPEERLFNAVSEIPRTFVLDHYRSRGAGRSSSFSAGSAAGAESARGAE